jgi:hypothetical protein
MKDTQIEEEVQLSLFAGIIPVHIKKTKQVNVLKS